MHSKTNKNFQTDLLNLATDFERYEKEQVALVFARMIQDLTSKAAVINEILANVVKPSAARKPIKDLICQEIVACTHGRLVVTEYVQKACAKQDFYLFVTTHWVLVSSQDFQDFVKDGCKQMQIPYEWAENPDFMNKVFEQIGFVVSHNQRQYVPSNEVWVNLINGTLKIKSDGTRSFGVHKMEDFFTHVLPYAYEEDAECPQWHKFLDRVLPDKNAQLLLAEYIGYCFTRNIKLEKMAVFYGIGCNGKSVTLDVLEALMGRNNVSNVSLSDVTRDPERRAHIENKLLNISHESGTDLDASSLKQLVSGEPVLCRVLYKGTHTMYNYGKFITSYNVLPDTEYTHGFFRRWLIFPFKEVIPESEQDINLTSKLRKELAGILNWALAALEGLVRRKRFSDCETCSEALNEFINGSNTALQFFEDRCELDDKARMQPKDLYKSYCTYCEEEGYNYPFGKKRFYEVLRGKNVNLVKCHGLMFANVKFKEEITAF